MNPVVTMKVKDKGAIVIELMPEYAPQSASNFINLVSEGFYNGLTFHRVIKGFMIQGGCPEGIGIGGPGYSIRGEFKSNGIKNDLKHERGVISMARAMDPNSGGSQFFLMHKDSPHLDGMYAAFGKIVEGLEVVDSIADSKTDPADKPLEDIVMESVTVELNGYEVEEVEKY
mgnify:CR=1 FL=1